MEVTATPELLVKLRAFSKKSIWWFVLSVFVSGCVSTSDTNNPAATFATNHAEFMLTFDDGPLPISTGRILDMLGTIKAIDGTPVKAGFFLLADAPQTFWQRRFYYAVFDLWTNKGSIARYPEIAQHIQQAGHVIGNHTTHHSWFQWPWLNRRAAVMAEITEWEAMATPVLGTAGVRIFRPPNFVITQNVQEVTDELGYQIVLGEPTGDTSPFMSIATIESRTEAILANWDKPYPCVLVFHEMRPVTYQHLDEIVTNLQMKGFRLLHFDPSRLPAQ